VSKRILVVEDQTDTRQIIRDMLASTDYEITEAENGEQALAAIAKRRPDLILMDIQLPIVDGYTATRQIKSDPALRSIPIIAVTSYALREEENKARAAGCDDYVPKPFSPRQLPGENSQFPAIAGGVKRTWPIFMSTRPRFSDASLRDGLERVRHPARCAAQCRCPRQFRGQLCSCLYLRAIVPGCAFQ